MALFLAAVMTFSPVFPALHILIPQLKSDLSALQAPTGDAVLLLAKKAIVTRLAVDNGAAMLFHGLVYQNLFKGAGLSTNLASFINAGQAGSGEHWSDAQSLLGDLKAISYKLKANIVGAPQSLAEEIDEIVADSTTSEGQILVNVAPPEGDSDFQVGDVVHAFNRKRILTVHAEMITNTRNFSFTSQGLREPDTLLDIYLRNAREFKFERVGSTEVKKINLATGEETIIGNEPNEEGEHMDVPFYIQRRLKHERHLIFGQPGREYWYGGSENITEEKLDRIWDAIEEKTEHRRDEVTGYPVDAGEQDEFRLIPVVDFSDEKAGELTAVQGEEESSQRKYQLDVDKLREADGGGITADEIIKESTNGDDAGSSEEESAASALKQLTRTAYNLLFSAPSSRAAGTVTTSIGTNDRNADITAVSGAGPYTVTLADASTAKVGDALWDEHATPRKYLITAISSNDLTVRDSESVGGAPDASATSTAQVKRYYATMTLWEADLDDTGVYASGDDAVGEVYNDSVYDESVAINGGGTVGLASRTLTVPSGERHDGTAASGARIVASTTAKSITASVASTSIEWIEIDENNLTFNDGSAIAINGSNNGFVRNVMVHSVRGRKPAGIKLGNHNFTGTILNSLVYDVDNSSDSSQAAVGIAAVIGSGTSPTRVLNSTVFNIRNSAGGATAVGITYSDLSQREVRNTVSVNCLSACFSPTTNASATVSHNAASDTTATGTGSIDSITTADQFVSTVDGSEDLHLKAGADVIDAGTDLGTTPTGVNIDIDGFNRDSSGAAWDIGADESTAARTISGTVYSDEGTTPLTSKTVALSINGAAATTTTSDGTTGAYSFSNVNVGPGDVLTLYLDNHTEDAVTVTKSGIANITGLDLYQNRLITRSDDGFALTNTHLDTANNNGDADISAIYTTSGTALTIVNGKELFVLSGHTFAPGDTTTIGTSGITSGLDMRGTYTHGSETLTVRGTYSQSSGLFNGGSGSIVFGQTSVGGSFLLSGGTFTSTTGTLSLPNTTLTFSGGTFSHNNGTVAVIGGDAQTYNVDTSATFYNFTMNKAANTSITISANDTFIIEGTLSLIQGNITQADNGAPSTLDARGNVTQESTFAYASQKALTVKLGGSTTQTYTVNGGNTPGINIANANASVVFADGINSVVTGPFTMSAGTFTSTNGTLTMCGMGDTGKNISISGGTFNHNDGTIIFKCVNSSSIDVNSSLTLNNVEFSAYTTGVNQTIASGDTLIVEGTLTLTEGQVDTGTVQAQGNVVVGANFDAGNSPLQFTGTANQTYTDNGGNELDGDITINKSSGTVTLASNADWNATSQDVTITDGTLDLAAYSLSTNALTVTDTLELVGPGNVTATSKTLNSGSTIRFTGDGDSNIDQYTISDFATTYHHLTINSADSGDVFRAASALTVNGTLTLTDGTLALPGSGNTIAAQSISTTAGKVMYTGTSSATGLALGNSYYNLTINDGLVGYWKFDETSAGPFVDSSGYGHTGTGSGSSGGNNTPQPTSTKATLNYANTRALDFDGTDDYVATTFNPNTELGTGSVSFATWVRLDDLGSSTTLTSTFLGGFNNAGTNKRLYVRSDSSGLVRAGFGGGHIPTSSTVLSTGSWYHIAATFNGTTAKIYVNGAEETLGSASGTLSADYFDYNLPIGELFGGSGSPYTGGGSDNHYHDGQIDDVRIYSRVLSATEVARLAAGNQPATASATYTLNANLDVNSDLTLAAGGINTSGTNYSLNVGGNWNDYGGVFTPNSSTVTFDKASGTQTLSGSGSSSLNAFSSVTKSTGGTLAFGSHNIKVPGTLTIDASTTIHTSGYGSTVGTLTNNGTLKHNGSETFAATTFDSDSGTVVYTGDGDGSSDTFPIHNYTFNNLQPGFTDSGDILSADPSLDHGLVGYWKFDETSAGAFADSSGSGNTGTGTGASGGNNTPQPTTEKGSLQFTNTRALDFDGTDDYVNAGDAAVIDASNTAITVSFWTRADSLTGRHDPISKYDATNNEREFLFYLNGANPRWTVQEVANSYSSTTDITSSENLTTGVWYHLVGTFKSKSELKLYVNGVERASLSASSVPMDFANTDQALFVGRVGDSTANFFDGQIDDVRVYNRALSSTEISNLANGWSGRGSLTAVTVNGNLDIASGTFDLAGTDLTLGGSSTFSNSGTLKLQGDETLTNFTNDTDSGTVQYAGSGTTGLTAGNEYSGLTFSAGTWDPNADLTIAGNFSAAAATLSNLLSRIFTLSGETQSFAPGNVTLGTLSLAAGSGTVTLGSSFTLGTLLSIASGRTLNLSSSTLTSNGNITNASVIALSSGQLVHDSSGFYIADDNFDEDAAISLGSDRLYFTVTDEDGNLNGTSADTLTNAVTVTCANGAFTNDSETVTLTETGNATEVFRYTTGLLSAVGDASVTTNDGTLECQDGETITATYTDPQDGSDTLQDTTAATSDTIPTAPSALSGSADSSSAITWSWTDNSNNETGFKLYNAANDALIATIATASATSYQETGLSPVTTYQRYVRSYNDAGNSSASNTASETTEASTPAAPSGFGGSAASSTSITWSWTDNADNETGFKLLDSSNNVIATINSANTTSYTETGLAAGTSYTRKILAFNGNGDSAASSTATVSTSASTAPKAFSLLSPGSGALLNTNLPTFSWNKALDDESDITNYTLTITPPTGSSFSFTIPKDGAAAGGTTYSTDTFTAQYFNENDGNSNNDSISVTLKGGSINQLPLQNGEHGWRVTAADEAGNATSSASRSFGIDTEGAQVVSIAGTGNITSLTPEVTITLTDNQGLRELVVTLQEAKKILGVVASYSDRQTRTYPLSGTGATETYVPSAALEAGKTYRLSLTVTDGAGNTTRENTDIIVLTAEQAQAEQEEAEREAAFEEVAQLNAETAPVEEIVEILRGLLPDSPFSIPDLEEQAALRRARQAENFDKLFTSVIERALLALTSGNAWLQASTTAVLEGAAAFVNDAQGVLARLRVGVLYALDTTWRGAVQIAAGTAATLLGTGDRAGAVVLALVRAAAGGLQSSVVTAGTTIAAAADAFFGIDIVSPLQRAVAWIAVPNYDASSLQAARGQTSMALIGTIGEGMRAARSQTVEALAVGRQTRVRQGLANRQTVNRVLEQVIAPAQRFARRAYRLAQYNYEVILDKEPTRISNLKIVELTPTSAAIEWETNHLTRSGKVNYGTDSSEAYPDSAFEDRGLKRQHRVELTNLDPATTYYFEVMNQNGGYVYDAYYTLTTPSDTPIETPLVPQDVLINDGEGNVVVYSAPSPDAEVIRTLPSGERLRALLINDSGWVSVLLPSGREGWVRYTDVTLVPQQQPSAEASREAE